MAHVLGRDRSWLYAWPITGWTRPNWSASPGWSRRVRPPPGRPPDRTARVLVTAVRRQRAHPDPASGDRTPGRDRAVTRPAACAVLDLGTGSGAIAIALAQQRPTWQIIAVDDGEAALAVARENARRLGTENVHFRCSDWFSGLATGALRADRHQPPYIAADDPHLGQGDVRFEPATALVSGPDGLDDLRRITAASTGLQLVDGCGWSTDTNKRTRLPNCCARTDSTPSTHTATSPDSLAQRRLHAPELTLLTPPSLGYCRRLNDRRIGDGPTTIRGEFVVTLTDLVSAINGVVWGPLMLALILGVGLFLQAGLKAMPIRTSGAVSSCCFLPGARSTRSSNPRARSRRSTH